MSKELHGLERVAAAIKSQIRAEEKPPGSPQKHASKPATNSELAAFEPELRRVLNKSPRAEQANLDRLWRKSFDNDPTACLLMLRSIK